LKINPEAELLLCCARSRMTANMAARIEALLRESLDWEYLLRVANRHGLGPLLYRQLKAVSAERIPAVYAQQLAELFRRNAARNVILTGELCRLLRLFAARGLPVIPYKGPALAVYAYSGDLALRQFTDLDILVHERDLSQFREVLSAEGYWSRLHPENSQHAAYMRLRGEQLFLQRESKIEIDLTWMLSPRYHSFKIDYERCWERLEKIEIQGTETWALAPEDLLLALCVHAGKHQWERLIWVCDVAETLAARPEMKWEQLVSLAEESGVRRMLWLGLLLAHEMLGASLPDWIVRRLEADSTVKVLSARIQERFFHEPAAAFAPSEKFSYLLQVREKRRDGLRACLHYTVSPTPADWKWVRLPASLSFLYYLTPPVRLFQKHTMRHLKRPYEP